MNPSGHTSRSAASVTPRRDHAVDLLRTLAIIGMMAAHTARLIAYDVRPDWARLVLRIEPLIPSLFLFLVGLSLVHSFETARARGEPARAWYGRQLKRAGGLWLISALFFALEMGVRLPDMVLAGGILANIAYAIALTGALLALPAAGFTESPRTRTRTTAPGPARARRGLALVAALAAASALFVWLDLGGARVHPVNIGNSPFLPLWLFAFSGALWGTLTFRTTGDVPGGPSTTSVPPEARPATSRSTLSRVRLVVAGLAAGALALTMIVSIARYGFEVLFTNPVGRSDAGRLVPAPVHGGSPLDVSYYNLKPLLALTCLGFHVTALVVFGALQDGLRRVLPGPGSPEGRHPGRFVTRLTTRCAALLRGTGRNALALGRHALAAYILHLALLAALIVITGTRHPLRSGWQGSVTLLGVILICQAYTILRERNKNLRFRH